MSVFDNTTEKINDPKTIDTIFDNIANGGSLIDLCELWNASYVLILRWIYDDAIRTKRYQDALDARNEWVVQRLLSELKSLAFVDVRLLFDEKHKLLPPEKWPVDVARAIAGIDADATGVTKVKLYDKLKSIELLGKDLGRFIQKHEVSAKVTLEDLVAGSKKDESIPRNSDQ